VLERGPRTIIRGSAIPARVVERDTDSELETPTLRTRAETPITIEVPRFVQSVMAYDCWTLTRSDDREAGGFLLAKTPRGRDTSVRLFHATGTADAIRTTDSLALDHAECMRAERWIEANGWDDVEVVGLWHTHPRSWNGRPSAPDRRAFLGCLDWSAEVGRSAAFTVGLILYPDFEGMWGMPRVDGWVTRRTRFGTAVTEPATVRRV
jgi:hypothetical protein